MHPVTSSVPRLARSSASRTTSRSTRTGSTSSCPRRTAKSRRASPAPTRTALVAVPRASSLSRPPRQAARGRSKHSRPYRRSRAGPVSRASSSPTGPDRPRKRDRASSACRAGMVRKRRSRTRRASATSTARARRVATNPFRTSFRRPPRRRSVRSLYPSYFQTPYLPWTRVGSTCPRTLRTSSRRGTSRRRHIRRTRRGRCRTEVFPQANA